MSSVATRKLYTPEDLLTRANGDDFELVDGHLEKRAMSWFSSYLSGVLFNLLMNHCTAQRLGLVFPEGTSYECFGPQGKNVRRLDVSFIRRGRLVTKSPHGHIMILPDFAVEVLSPRDIAYRVNKKIKEFVQAAIPLVWVIDPENQLVHIYRPGQPLVELGLDDELTGEDIVPGFRCTLRELLAALEENR